MSTIFLDRDGVINENRADYVKSWSEFRFLDGSREAIAKLTLAGHRIVVCTNQAGVARGHVSIETVEEIHRCMMASVAELGGVIEKVYYCPHGKDENCDCRKPRPGMLLRARDELGVDLSEAMFIGDSMTDIQAGIAAGVDSMLVLTGLGIEQFRNHINDTDGQFRVSTSLKHAAEYLLQRSRIPMDAQSKLASSCFSMPDVTEYLDAFTPGYDQIAVLSRRSKVSRTP